MLTREPADPRYSTLASCDDVESGDTGEDERSASSSARQSAIDDDCESRVSFGSSSAGEGENEAFLQSPREGDDVSVVSASPNKKKKQKQKYVLLGSFLLLAAVVAVGQELWHTTWNSNSMEEDYGSNNNNNNNNNLQTVHYNWNGKKCFESNWELTDAIDAYLLDKTNETIEQVYGLPIGVWCTKYVQDFSFLFAVDRNDELSEQLKAFNDDIREWDTSSVVSLDATFRGTEEFNQDLKWDTRNVVTMRGTFAFTRRFDGDIRGWDVSKVTSFEAMFYEAQRFDRNLVYWNVKSATNMISMFRNAPRFNQDLCEWGEHLTSNTMVTGMFLSSGCPLESNVGPFFYDNDNDKNPNHRRPGPFCHPC